MGIYLKHNIKTLYFAKSPFWLLFGNCFPQVLAFLNSILLLSQLNQIVVIATGCNSCSYIYNSSSDSNHSSEALGMPALYSNLLQKLEEFVAKDEQLGKAQTPGAIASSLLSGSLSMALCCILFIYFLSKTLDIVDFFF